MTTGIRRQRLNPNHEFGSCAADCCENMATWVATQTYLFNSSHPTFPDAQCCWFGTVESPLTFPTPLNVISNPDPTIHPTNWQCLWESVLSINSEQCFNDFSADYTLEELRLQLGHDLGGVPRAEILWQYEQVQDTSVRPTMRYSYDFFQGVGLEPRDYISGMQNNCRCYMGRLIPTLNDATNPPNGISTWPNGVFPETCTSELRLDDGPYCCDCDYSDLVRPTGHRLTFTQSGDWPAIYNYQVNLSGTIYDITLTGEDILYNFTLVKDIPFESPLPGGFDWQRQQCLHDPQQADVVPVSAATQLVEWERPPIQGGGTAFWRRDYTTATRNFSANTLPPPLFNNDLYQEYTAINQLAYTDSSSGDGVPPFGNPTGPVGYGWGNCAPDTISPPVYPKHCDIGGGSRPGVLYSCNNLPTLGGFAVTATLEWDRQEF